MLKKLIQAAGANIGSLKRRFSGYLQNERTRIISDRENAETGIALFFVVLVFVLAGLK